MNKPNLTNQNHNEMDDFLKRVLEGYKNEEITIESAIDGLAHVMAALDIGNTGEAVSWFKSEGLSFFKDV